MQETFQKFILQPDSTKSKITTQSKLCTSGGLPLNSARPIITSNSLHTPHVIFFHFSAVVLSFHILFIFHVNLYDFIEPFLVAREVPSRKNFLWIMHKHYFTQLSEKKHYRTASKFIILTRHQKIIFFCKQKGEKILQSTDITENKNTDRT